MSWPQCIKTHKVVWVLGNGPFPGQVPVGGAHGAGSPIQQYDFFVEQTLKISINFMQRIKSYSIFTIRQTDTQTDAHFASLYAWARFFSIWKFIPFTTLRKWVSLAHSLTSFVKDKNLFAKKSSQPHLARMCLNNLAKNWIVQITCKHAAAERKKCQSCLKLTTFFFFFFGFFFDLVLVVISIDSSSAVKIKPKNRNNSNSINY